MDAWVLGWSILVVIAGCSSPAELADGAGPGGDATRGPADAAIDATPCRDTGVQGCACAPVAPGGGGTITVDIPILKLVGDPRRCAVYGLTASAVIVIDTRLKSEVARVPLIAAATDLDISNDGTYAVVAHGPSRGVSVLDLDQRVVTTVLPVSADPDRIEVSDAGISYYATASAIHRLDLATGQDLLMGQNVAYMPDIELAPDGNSLYVGDSSTSSGALRAYDVASSGFVFIATTHWESGLGFYNPARQVLVSRAGHAYYAAHQWLAGDLTFVTSGTGESVLAEDDAGRIAIGPHRVWDAALGLVIMNTETISGAAFAAADQEVWTYGSNRLRYVATTELIGSVALGAREVPPLQLSAYQFGYLVHDPSRAVLYGSAQARDAVVVIDDVTLAPLVEIRVGTEPTDLAFDPSGNTLYVGHGDLEAITVVSLDPIGFGHFVPTPKLPYEVEAAGPGRVVFNDRDQFTRPVLFNINTGLVRAEVPIDLVAASIAVEGNVLFAGESIGSFCNLYKYAIGTSSLTEIDRTNQGMSAGFPSPPRILALSAGTDVFYASRAFAQLDLTQPRYSVTEPVRVVTPDGRLALSAGRVWDRATGADLGPLPGAAAQTIAVDPASHRAFRVNGVNVTIVDLDVYQP